ncbi:O-antigen ligase family protein [Vibrio sp. VB16]|uniref:O-antigen ligase family protein n=1 Tax=Vibrio sp. VB16 TaxID=2785746 RepID=UPI00189DA242|nr:O-antigen ligase family protein [Vibrio sp. VB16]UGA57733.1 O-antigen ligase family protein [Vibrio sp. VB16]
MKLSPKTHIPSGHRYAGITLVTLCCAVISLIWTIAPNPVVALILCALPLGVLFVINHMFGLVFLFVIFSFFRIHEVIPVLYPLKIPLLLSAGALLALAWHSVISKTLTPYWHPSLSWLVAFWVLILIGIALASNRPIAIEYFKNIYWKIMIMTLAIIWIVNQAKYLSYITLLINFSGLLVGSVAVYNSINGIGLVEGSRVTIGRDIGSMLGDPNDLALVLMFPLAFSISTFITKKNPLMLRMFAIVISAILIYSIIATQSRGGLLGTLAIFSVLALGKIRSKTLLFFLGITVTLFLYFFAGISERASGGAAEIGVDASAMGRLYAWQAAFRMSLENPLTGVGLNNFYSNYFYYSSHWDGLNHAVHSTWFGVLAETGMLGLFVFISFIVSLIRTAKNTVNKVKTHTYPASVETMANAVYAGLIGTVISGTFLTQGFNWPIYILAALTICVAQIASQNENSKQEIL